jgi:hypothetical protein
MTWHRCFRTLCLFLFMVAAMSAGPARAAIVMTVESKAVGSDPANTANGFFDVFFNVSGENPAVAGYQLRLDLSPPNAGVSLGTPVSTNTGDPVRTPLFSTAPVDLGSTPGRIQVTDYLPTGAKTISNLDGLVRIPFTVAANTAGAFDLTINTSQTALSDSAGGPIAFQTVNGRLSVEPIPEPTALVLLLIAIMPIGMQILKRRPFDYRSTIRRA